MPSVRVGTNYWLPICQEAIYKYNLLLKSMAKIRIFRPNPERNLYLFVQLVVPFGLLTLARQIYFQHPYYVEFLKPNAIQFMDGLYFCLLLVVLIDGLIKFFTYEKLPETKSSHIFAYLYSTLSKLRYGKLRPSSLQMEAVTRTAFLSVLVKFFFLPIMLNTFVGNTGYMLEDITKFNAGTLPVNFDTVYPFLVNIIFIVDTGIFAFGYTFEAKWLRNQIRSVESTFLGWVVALATYPPFNQLTGQIFPMYTNGNTALAQNQEISRFILILILICHIGFVSASIALFTRGSNLTNRGIVSTGPYKFVRHPAYTFKLIAFFLQGLLYASGFTYYTGWLGFAFLYALRAWTEERHLKQDPDYVKYRQRVRWACIPGIV